ncbi:MAG: hypothetical protein HY939_02615 [Gammaproteobacteria bacterium]|nr:hypothetical protein [Gammaproteobacteria bacterium]
MPRPIVETAQALALLQEGKVDELDVLLKQGDASFHQTFSRYRNPFDGNTIYHLAALHNSESLLKLLLVRYGSEGLCEKNKKDLNPVELARSRGKEGMAILNFAVTWLRDAWGEESSVVVRLEKRLVSDENEKLVRCFSDMAVKDTISSTSLASTSVAASSSMEEEGVVRRGRSASGCTVRPLGTRHAGGGAFFSAPDNASDEMEVDFQNSRSPSPF